MRQLLVILVILITCYACQKDEKPPIAPAVADEQLSGGINGTTFDKSSNAFGVQLKGLTADEEGFFVTGNAFFRSNWVVAPASVQTLDGLGPVFNAISCGSCHFKDGRAQPPTTPDAPLNGLLFRLSVAGMGLHGAPLGDPIYGGQLQDKAILNIKNEGRVRVAYQELSGSYRDGSVYTLRQPSYDILDLNYGDFAPGIMVSPRIAQQVPGLGLLEIVPEQEILSFVDENDSNKDGISGRANYVWDIGTQTTLLGRFGWKANQPNLLQQTAGAFNGDIGITTNLVPNSHFSPIQEQQYPTIPNGGSPELSDELLLKVVSYIRSLSVPAARDYDDVTVLRGKYLFKDLNCAGCHRPTLITGNEGSISALKNQKIWPYTDLLLHDMGAELADGRPDFQASGAEWRTPPLWGIGLLQTVNGHTSLLHDGRARNVEEAILWHGGEAANARKGFTELSATDRDAVIAFIHSL
jgi:CxxC motif-containing protein (DUF1111 family)